ncbi:hypothetical protein B566_EDAN013831 [Ephemera danica]|nr:hypothetical protein B566_EDAN013831 [Ephemera danica]
MPRGAGYVRYKLLSREAFIKKCRGILEIKNRDNNCLSYALFVGLRLAFDPKLKENIQDEDFVMQRGAQDLCNRAGVNLDQGGGYKELGQFQAVMPPKVEIVVHTDLDGRSIYFKGEVNDVRYRVNLLLSNNHYDVIRSTVGAFACNYYCEEFNTHHSRRDQHKCREACSNCLKMPPCEKNIDAITCDKCFREFFNRQCFANHSTNVLYKKETVCDIHKKCPRCFRTYKKYPGRPMHTCGEYFCKTCKKHCPRDHKCYMRKDRLTKPPSDKDVMYVFWDSECTQDTPVSDEESDGFYHRVNLICAQTICRRCEDAELDYQCPNCGERQYIFIEDPLKNFMDFLCVTRKHFKKIICIAHNSSSYDSHFILKYVLTTMTVKPKIIMRGAQILCLEVNKLKFIDSFHYFPMALKSLPASFDMPADVNKGYFPHFFNNAQNQNYEGDISDVRFYGAGDMAAKEHAKFLDWHAQRVQENYVFNFREELVKCCKRDVYILTQANFKI